MNKFYPNQLGVKGWAVGGKWSFERYMYTLHRLSALALLFYFVLHIFVTSTRLFGVDTWERVMGHLTQPYVNLGEYFIFLAFAFHAFNGLRLIAIEMFGAVGKPIEPIYPYETSLHTTRPLMTILYILMIIVMVAGSYDFFSNFYGH
jgi:succinate dehydrogenase / fumarate reductase cytochrome b subunit